MTERSRTHEWWDWLSEHSTRPSLTTRSLSPDSDPEYFPCCQLFPTSSPSRQSGLESVQLTEEWVEMYAGWRDQPVSKDPTPGCSTWNLVLPALGWIINKFVTGGFKWIKMYLSAFLRHNFSRIPLPAKKNDFTVCNFFLKVLPRLDGRNSGDLPHELIH